MSDQIQEAVDNKYVSRVTFGSDYTTNREVLANILNSSDDASEIGSDTVKELLNAMPEYALKGKKRDTHIGGNDVINSYYQFNENDDLIHPLNKTGNYDGAGMGRVYNETFDENQQTIYMSFGIPDFTNAASFIAGAYNDDLAKLMNNGDSDVIAKLAGFIGKTLGTIITLPLIPLRWAIKLLTSEASPGKYYDFKPTMSLYYKTVNVILAHIAANMDLVEVVEKGADASAKSGDAPPGVPDLIKTHGLDILTILSRRHWYDNLAKAGGAGDAANPKTDEILKQLSADQLYEQKIWKGVMNGGELALTESLRYVGFKLEKSTSSSESASNSTKEAAFLSMVNGQVSAGREATFAMSSLANAGLIGGAMKTVYGAIEGVVKGVADSVGLIGGVEMLKGAGFLDVPELWANSHFAKSYTFSFQLRSPYGDPLSIFYSLYIPLAMMLAGALPRSVGQNTYTSPYLVRAFSQGMFAIPLGIIDSINIKRGNAEYGWANGSGMLPTEIDIDFTIKDLSPIMHVALMDGGFEDWLKIFGQNSTFQEYLLTLSGVNIAQRSLVLERLKQRSKALLKILSNNKLNPMMIGFSLGNTKLGRVMTMMTPSQLPGRVKKQTG